VVREEMNEVMLLACDDLPSSPSSIFGTFDDTGYIDSIYHSP
jgi:hypothetical protein